MSSVSEIQRVSNLSWQMPKERIRIQFSSDVCTPEEVVQRVASIQGPVDLYTWYEGTQGLPKRGAKFMKECIFQPLYLRKNEIKFWLYSLRAWDFKKDLNRMADSNPLGEVINTINQASIACIQSASFFRYCTEVSKESGLYAYLSQALPAKAWLFKLFDCNPSSGSTVADLFKNKNSLFDCIKELDLNVAYSSMQYVEGYYLIQKSVREALLKNQKKIEIVFLLPNDESKYYQDYQEEIAKLLIIDFGAALGDLQINIAFHFFVYGNSVNCRPYSERQGGKVKPEEVISYFDFLSEQSRPLSRDIIHKLNEVFTVHKDA